MIKVTIGNNVKRKTIILDENTTLRQAAEDAEIDYSRGTMNLDGSSLGPGDLDKPLQTSESQTSASCSTSSKRIMRNIGIRNRN